MSARIQTLEQTLAHSKTPFDKIQVMNQLAEELQYTDLERAIAIAKEAEQIALANNDQKSSNYADIVCNLGSFYLRKGEIETAVTQLFTALQIYRQQNNPAGRARTSGLIGITFSQIGNYPEALNYLLIQLQLSQKHTLPQQEAIAYNGIGIVHAATENYAEALQAHQKSIQIAEANQHMRQKASALSNCTHAARHLEQYQDAFAYGQESIQLSQEVGNKITESNARLEIANTYLQRQEFHKALEQLQTNFKQLNNTQYVHPRIDTLITIGNLYNQWQKPEQAFPHLQQALALSEKVQAISYTYRCHQALAQTYQIQQGFAQALEHYQQFHTLKETVLNQQSLSNLHAIEASYHMQVTAQEKSFLEDKNKELENLITERITIEQELKNYQDHLEELVAQRTDKLQKQNEELERFTYTVSHDLKSPLITIRGFIGLLQRDIIANDEIKIERDITRIDAAAERMLSLLEDLLELSKVGHTIDTLAYVPIQAIILEAIDLVTGRIKENDVTMIVENNLPEIYGDYPRLVELFQNLIENGCKFMGTQPNPQITIGAKKKEDDTILCFVQDNGIGIEAQYQDKIFNLFERLDPSTDGTGIGLALVKRIIEQHNGRIWVESEGKDKGSTFCFTLKAPTFPEQEHAT